MSTPRTLTPGLLVVTCALLTLTFCQTARADSIIELSGATGFGALVAGVTSGRFTISPSVSLSVRGERWFFVARDTASFLGATGGRLGINNELTSGGGVFWEHVNLSAGLSLVAFSLPLCGPKLCGQVRGVGPGGSLRLDIFGPYLSGAIGISIDCAISYIGGRAAAIWSGVSGRCAAGPIIRFTSNPS